MIDVFEEIKDLIIFEDEDDFYYLQILQRKKENSHLITTPFNLQKFKQDFKNIEIHKDNPVNLFIP